jgi:uncharacterized protein
MMQGRNLTKKTDLSVLHKNTFKNIPWYDLKGQFFYFWNRLVCLNDSPHAIALGLSLGIFVGFLPLMGVQMAVVLAFAIPFRKANKFSAIAGVWISNPVTVIPLYAFIYWVGTLFYRNEEVLSYPLFRERITDVLELDGFLDKTASFLGIGADLFIPMFIGGTFAGIIVGFIAYFISKKVIVYYRRSGKKVCE